MKKYYVYKLDDPITNQFYFGSRGFNGNPNDDIYMGSMKDWKPEDKSRLIKTILKNDFNSMSSAMEYESKLIKKNIDNPLNENYYIPNKGFHVDGKYISNFTKQLMSSTRIKRGIAVGKSNGMYGRHHTKETIKKISDEKTGKLNPKKWKIIIQLTTDNEFIKEWKSATLASNDLNLNNSHICQCYKGNRRTHGNFIWKYKERVV